MVMRTRCLSYRLPLQLAMSRSTFRHGWARRRCSFPNNNRSSPGNSPGDGNSRRTRFPAGYRPDDASGAGGRGGRFVRVGLSCLTLLDSRLAHPDPQAHDRSCYALQARAAARGSRYPGHARASTALTRTSPKDRGKIVRIQGSRSCWKVPVNADRDFSHQRAPVRASPTAIDLPLGRYPAATANRAFLRRPNGDLTKRSDLW
jgi:hypothetical protein